MSTTKRLERSRDQRMIAGVCGGLARYTGIDVSLVRIAIAALTLFTGVGVIAYLIAALVIPEEGTGSAPFFNDNGGQFWKPTGSANAADPTKTDGPIYREDLR